MYTSSDNRTRSLIQIPVILYTVEQIFVGQFMIWYFKRWLAKDRARLDAEVGEKEAAVVGDTGVLGSEDKGDDGISEEVQAGGIGGADGTAGAASTVEALDHIPGVKGHSPK